ncbi:class I SAM-dependent methyltransferase, partial [Erwinia mallotivora]
EPSAGTGAILRAVLDAAPGISCEAVEMHIALARQLATAFPAVPVHNQDFLHWSPETRYSLIVMNPPFRNGADIRHIRHAQSLLAPGGRLVAVCAAGSRQQRDLLPDAVHSERLPRGAFAYTDVATMIVRIDGPECPN